MAAFQGNDETDFKFDDINDESSIGASSENSLANLQIIRNHVDTFILSMLSKNDCYGYEIMREIDTRTHGKYNLKQPTLYSCLKRLEKKGDISSYWGTISNGARRRYYSLTKQGREFLESELECWEFERTIGDKLLSDKLIDLENYTVPFSEKDLKPKTKREKSPKFYDDDFSEKESSSSDYSDDKNVDKIFNDNYNVKNNDEKEISAIEKYAYEDSVQNLDNLKDYIYKKSHNEQVNNHYFENDNVSEQNERNISDNFEYSTDSNSNKYSNDTIENEYSKNLSSNAENSNEYFDSNENFYKNQNELLAKNNIFTYRDSPEDYKSEEENYDENEAMSHEIVTEPIDEDDRLFDSANKNKPNTDYVEKFFEKDASDSEDALQNKKTEEQIKRKQEALKNLYPENYSSLFEDGDYSFSKKNVKKAEENKKAEEKIIEESKYENNTSKEPNYFANQGAIKNKEIQNIAQLSKFYKTDNNKDVLENIESSDSADSELGYTSMSELKMKLYNKGFKLRPYSKENVSGYYSMNFIYANAIRRDTSFIMYAIVFFELLLAYLSFFSLLELKLWPFIVAALVFLVVPVYFFFVNHFDPNFRTRAKFDLKISLINSIMAFLCIVAIVVLLGFYVFHARFDDAKTMIMPIFVPIIFALDIPIAVLIYSILYKSKKYHLS